MTILYKNGVVLNVFKIIQAQGHRAKWWSDTMRFERQIHDKLVTKNFVTKVQIEKQNISMTAILLDTSFCIESQYLVFFLYFAVVLDLSDF